MWFAVDPRAWSKEIGVCAERAPWPDTEPTRGPRQQHVVRLTRRLSS